MLCTESGLTAPRSAPKGWTFFLTPGIDMLCSKVCTQQGAQQQFMLCVRAGLAAPEGAPAELEGGPIALAGLTAFLGMHLLSIGGNSCFKSE
jgi:hypothetical protein